jgi:large subunit ribosomal protein L47
MRFYLYNTTYLEPIAMAQSSISRAARSRTYDIRYPPPLFLAPCLSPTLHPPSAPQTHPFSSTPHPQIRLRNRAKNKSRGVSAIRRTGPRVPLTISKYELPEPVWDPPARKEFKTRDDHGLWGFFNKERTPMSSPEELHAHGRAWTYDELQNKIWQDLWKIWWMAVKERNRLATEANERKRVEAGYGDSEGKGRDAVVSCGFLSTSL